MYCFGTFNLELFDTNCHILNQHRQTCWAANFREKRIMPKIGKENAWCLTCSQKMPCFGTFNIKICNTNCHIWNQHCQTSRPSNFRKKRIMPKNGRENVWLRCFLTRILKHYCHIWNHHAQICLTPKFHKKEKNTKI